MSAAVDTLPAEEAATAGGIACHCGGDDTGHVPGSDGCAEAPIKPRKPRPFSTGPRLPTDTARGTCPSCGRGGVKVTGEKRLGASLGLTADAVHRVPLGINVTLAAHKATGRGAGACGYRGAPAELRFVPSAAVAVWEREHGPGSVR